jgi:hypothetical protein
VSDSGFKYISYDSSVLNNLHADNPELDNNRMQTEKEFENGANWDTPNTGTALNATDKVDLPRSFDSQQPTP